MNKHFFFVKDGIQNNAKFTTTTTTSTTITNTTTIFPGEVLSGGGRVPRERVLKHSIGCL